MTNTKADTATNYKSFCRNHY